jgi:cobalt-zinc-cadmium efflux system protein
MTVAAIGIGINGITAWMFMAGRKGDVNIRGAFMHMASDAVVSLGVVLSAFAMLRTGWLWIDPVVSLAIVIVIAFGTWSLLRESLDLALDAVPAHIWGMSTTEAALTVHLVKPDATLDDALLARINEDLHAQFGIDHVTVQFELGDAAHPCGQAAPSKV